MAIYVDSFDMSRRRVDIPGAFRHVAKFDSNRPYNALPTSPHRSVMGEARLWSNTLHAKRVGVMGVSPVPLAGPF